MLLMKLIARLIRNATDLSSSTNLYDISSNSKNYA